MYHLLHGPAPDDPAQQEQVKNKFKYGKEIIKNQVIPVLRSQVRIKDLYRQCHEKEGYQPFQVYGIALSVGKDTGQQAQCNKVNINGEKIHSAARAIKVQIKQDLPVQEVPGLR